ncbi:MAG: hypothetical protein IJS65_00395 [Clostridia bacterium]|nr:hypothetical protein [Clostridia bacterium]
MIRKTYESFKASCTEEEKRRIEEEIALFETRGWSGLVPAVCDLLADIGDKKGVFKGSVTDSYFIRKVIDPSFSDRGFLCDVRRKDELFNDTLRMIFEYRAPSLPVGDLKALEDAFTRVLEKKHGLKARQHLSGDKKSETIAFSESEISDKEFDAVVNERRDSTPAEADILRKFLIVKVQHVHTI